MRNYDVIFARTILIGRWELIAQKSYGVQNKMFFWLMIVQQWKKILTCSFFCWKDILFSFVIQFKAWKLEFILTGSKVVTDGTSIFWTFCGNFNEVAWRYDGIILTWFWSRRTQTLPLRRTTVPKNYTDFMAPSAIALLSESLPKHKFVKID